jgi:hypothetical protein
LGDAKVEEEEEVVMRVRWSNSIIACLKLGARPRKSEVSKAE